MSSQMRNQLDSASHTRPGEQAACKPVVSSAKPTQPQDVLDSAAVTRPTEPQDLLDFGGNEAESTAKRHSNEVNATQVDALGSGAKTSGGQQNAGQVDLLDLLEDAGSSTPSAATSSSAFQFVGTSSTVTASPVQTSPSSGNSSSAFSFVGSSAPQDVPTNNVAASVGYNSTIGSSAFGFINQQASDHGQKKMSEESLNLEALYANAVKAPSQQPSCVSEVKLEQKSSLDKFDAFNDLDILIK